MKGSTKIAVMTALGVAVGMVIYRQIEKNPLTAPFVS